MTGPGEVGRTDQFQNVMDFSVPIFVSACTNRAPNFIDDGEGPATMI